MYYLRNFDKQADAVGQKAYLPTIAIVGGVNKVGYFDGDASKDNVFTENDDFIKIGEAKETRLVCTYNVTSTSSTKICSATTNFASMEVDGIEVTAVTSTYTFTTTGEHTVKFTLEDTTTIGDSAFRGSLFNNSNLTSIVIPDSVTNIGKYAFAYCDGLTSVVIPDSVTTIGDSAFYDCTSLTSVTIGSGVTSIGNYAFQYCKYLTSITYKSTVAQWKAITRGTDWHKNVTATNVTCSDGSCGLDDK